MIAVIIVVVVGSLNDWQKERQFKVLNSKKEDRGVKVIRDGNETIVNVKVSHISCFFADVILKAPVKDVLVGDICLLELGEIVPVDGVFLRGHNVRCDESGATGESDAVRKASYEDCMEESRALIAADDGRHLKKDCFLISGSKVLEGVGAYVVIAVGEKSFNGRIMMGASGRYPPFRYFLI